jgi:hypothetical protein
LRAFGSENDVEALSNLIARKLATMRNKHAITLEHLRMGALKGVILDADGSTLYDLYSEFGITAKAINFALGTAGTEVLLKVLEVTGSKPGPIRSASSGWCSRPRTRPPLWRRLGGYFRRQ